MSVIGINDRQTAFRWTNNWTKLHSGQMCKLFPFHERRIWLDMTKSSEVPQEHFGIREEIHLNRFSFVITIRAQCSQARTSFSPSGHALHSRVLVYPQTCSVWR